MAGKSKALIITEKPSVARDIVAALGGFKSANGGAFWESEDYLCTFAVGHIFTLQAPEDIDPSLKTWQLLTLPIIPKSFELKPISGHEKRIEIIKGLLKRSDVKTLINACDSAREGELIFREIIQYLGAKQRTKRLWLQSLTTEAIKSGFAAMKSGSEFDGLAAAAACRSQTDWLIGMNATRAFSIKLRSHDAPWVAGAKPAKSVPWSVGRVQTPTLALLVRRELEIQRHVPKPFFRLTAAFTTLPGKATTHIYEGTWFDPAFKKPTEEENQDERDDRILGQERLEAIMTAVTSAPGPALASEKRDQSLRQAPYLFNLTGLQKYMATRWKWSSQRTLEAAQRCYEQHKVLTYPRTSSSALPADYKTEVERLIKLFSKHPDYAESAQYLATQGRRNDKRTFDDSAVTDHFAIIPTGTQKDLSGDDGKLYDVVVRRFLATFFPPAVYDKVKRITVLGGQQFRTGPIETLVEPGWMAVHGKEAEDPSEARAKLPPLIEGAAKAEKVPVQIVKDHGRNGLKIKEEMTKPPPHINEAKLLSLMEHAGRQVEDEELATALMSAEGLGTAATRADIIQNLKVKDYVDPDLRPTAKGIQLIETLDFLKVDRLTSAELTARLELELAEVEKGQRSAQTFMQSVVAYTADVVNAAKSLHGNPKAVVRAGASRYSNEPSNLRDHNQPVNNAELGPCPIHKDESCRVIETKNAYMCTSRLEAWRQGNQDAIGVSLPKILCQRPISRTEALAYLKGETPELKGFISKQGKPFSAKLMLTPSGRASFGFSDKPRPKASFHKSETSYEN